MRLIKVETKGFKSFADKITLNFDGGIVGVVGPNGSGKSNINDAIKWVLGETSAKSLRGDSMEDVIFAGSKKVPALDEATVSLTFDNSDKRANIPHKIFTISRSLKRGKGENNYFINGEPARLKDIKEIAMESGIGKSSLAIISQGTVSNIAQATPEDRRLIFEEVAGISKYKSRKLESLRKLDRTTDALEKVEAVVHELEKQLAPLKRQAEKAKIFLEKKEKLQDVEIGLIVEDVSFFGKKFDELSKELEGVVEAKGDLKERIEKSESSIKTKTSLKLSLENEVIDLTEKFQNVSDKLRDLEIRSSQESQRRQMIIDGQITSSSSSKLDAMREEIDDLSRKISQYNSWEEKAQNDIASKKVLVSETQTRISILHSEIDSAKGNLLKLKMKANILKDNKKNKSHLFKGAKTILENSGIFTGVFGMVADILDVDIKYKDAIQSVLANGLQHIVVKNPDDAVKCVNFLKQNRGGRATFIPLTSIKPKGIHDSHSMVANTLSGYLGIASDLIEVDAKFNILKRFLLGNIIVAETVESAKNISETLDRRYMVVSLDGDIIRSGGVISGGEKGTSKDLLGIDDQIQSLESDIPVLEKKINEKNTVLHQISNSIGEEQSLIAELNIELAKVREKRSIFQSQLSSIKVQYESETNEKLNLDNASIDESSSLIESEKLSLAALLKAKRESLVNLNNELSQVTLTKTELEKALREIIDDSSDKMTQKNQAEYVLNTSRQRLAEEYEMTPETASGKFSLSMDREEAREIVSNLRSEIKNLGHVNVDSIKDYEDVHARHEKLFTSREELLSAQQTILSAINEMDQIIISKLSSTVDDVNKEMNNIFGVMFGGGKAEVKYTDPSNLLETGIEVIAQPPGKTIKNLKLFSGGEKALVAITLLFAILKSKPLPLCILDEVEAALDDANVIRFANYLQELKVKTQFIVVTHRVGTMARVDHLFGATMQQRGVTSIFSVDLAKAKNMID